jgi:hypothetical protein
MKKFMSILLVALVVGFPVKNISQTSSYGYSTGNEIVSLVDGQQYSVGKYYGVELTKEEEEKLLKKVSTELKSKLEEIKKLDKKKYNSLLRSTSSNSMFFDGSFSGSGYVNGIELNEYAQDTKKQTELEIDIELIGLKYKNADANTQAGYKKDLTQKLSELFDLKEAKKQGEVKQLEKRLSDLKESLQARKQNKNEIVQRRIQEMLGDSRYLRWE